MFGFGAVTMVALPYWLGMEAMEKTNGGDNRSRLEKELHGQSGMDARILANAQKERLQVLLDEIRQGKGGERYTAALDGRSLGTHSVGTTAGAVAIRKESSTGP